MVDRKNLWFLFTAVVVSVLMTDIPTFPSASYGEVNTRLSTIATLSTTVTWQEASSIRPRELLFVGDILLARNVEALIKRHGNAYPFAGVSFRSWFPDAYVVGNFEAAVPAVHVPTPMMQLRFSVATTTLPALHEAGFTHLSLANNHADDHGKVDFQNTQTSLAMAGLNPFGHPNVFSTSSIEYMTTQGGTIALIGLLAIDDSPSRPNIEAVVKEASENSIFQILFVHWGTEYDLTSDHRQQALAHQFVRSGVDLIIGHHPHVVQEVGLIDGVPVFYSLGNYIFDQYSSRSVTDGLILMLDTTDRSKIRLLPVASHLALSQPQPMDKPDSEAFLARIALRSHPSLQEAIRDGYVLLHNRVASSSEIAMMSSTNRR